MPRPDPEQLILAWLEGVPKRYRDTLVCQWIFMTCNDSDELVLSGDEAWRSFRKKLLEPDFPLRRVARLLTIRSLFSFLLDYLSADAHAASRDDGADRTLPSLDAVQYLRANQLFRELAEADLSDAALQMWLQDLDA